jgi:hypothetical protein
MRDAGKILRKMISKREYCRKEISQTFEDEAEDFFYVSTERPLIGGTKCAERYSGIVSVLEIN